MIEKILFYFIMIGAFVLGWSEMWIYYNQPLMIAGVCLMFASLIITILMVDFDDKREELKGGMNKNG